MKNPSRQAKLLYREKLVLKSGLLRDGTIWQIPANERYPDGVRYRLALVDVDSGRIVALFDNHHPKGHHRHLEDGSETPYEFRSVGDLVEDFLAVVRQEERRREGKKN